jgi:hypothetical protein
LAEVLTDLLSEVIRSVVIPLFREVVAPAARQRITLIGERIRSGAALTATQTNRSVRITVRETAPAEGSTAIAPATDVTSIEMNPAQVREALLRLLASEHYASQLRTMLARARITGDLSPTELLGAIRSVVTGDIGSLNPSSRAALMDFLSAGIVNKDLAPTGRN